MLAATLAAVIVITAIADRPTVLIPAVSWCCSRSPPDTTVVLRSPGRGRRHVGFFVLIGLVARRHGVRRRTALTAVAWPALAVAAGAVVRQRRLTVARTIAEADARVRRCRSVPRRRRCGAMSPRNAFASPVNSTTSSPIGWQWSTCKPAPPLDLLRSALTRPRPRSASSGRRPPHGARRTGRRS